MSESLIRRNLRLSVDGQPFDVPYVLTSRGSFWWIFADSSGKPAYRGIEIEPTGASLPDHLTFEGEDLVLEPVPRYDSATQTTLDDTHPFEKTRRFHGRHVLEGVTLEVKVRITVKRNAKWNLSFRAWGADKPLMKQEPMPPGGVVDLLRGLSED